MSGLSTKENRVATKTELRQEIADLRHFGSLISNICFNLSQHVGKPLTAFDCETMGKMQRNWDAVKRSEAQR